MNENELYHFGIKGMKWGVRRYKNKDGKRTLAGKSVKKSAKKHKKSVKSYLKDTDPLNVRKMSDKDLDAKIERLKKEKQYKELRYDQLSSGEKFAHDVLGKAGKIVATGVAIYAGKKLVEAVFGANAAEFIKLPKK